LLDALRSTNAQIEAKNQELAESRKPSAQPRNVEADRDKFFADPVGTNLELIERVMDQRMAPFKSYIERAQVNDQVESMINKTKSNPQVAAKWDDSIENYVRSNIANLNPFTEASFNSLVATALGLHYIGALPGQSASTPSRPSNNRDDGRIMPPNIPPTRTSPIPTPSNATASRTLTEEEKRLAREMKMTEADYLAFMGIGRGAVASSEIGKIPPAPTPNGGTR
jgi:hypothetical protein